MPVRHAQNAPGDFYVEAGCCAGCGMHENEAPGLFGWSGGHCFVKKQPQAPAEISDMIQAFAANDLDCLRYSGADPDVLRQLNQIGARKQIDHPPTPARLRDRFRRH